MRVLFIAPLSPPITGQSVASEALLDRLRALFETTTVNLSLGSRHDGSVSGRRVVEVLRVLRAVWKERRAADVVYLTISESLAGNIKDLLIYLICARDLSCVVIHLHGGSIRHLLFDRYPLIEWVNARFLRRLGGVVISGRSHESIFAGMVPRQRLHVVPNFAPEPLFVRPEAVAAKFKQTRPLRVLYVSGMSRGKGYLDLADSFLGMDPELQARVQVDFAGRFDSEDEAREFRGRISGVEGLQYHGLVDEEAKRRLFAQAHVFCLPTAMREGQPISILEAYASGCAVLTTGQPGIRDIFTAGKNGFEIEQHAPQSIADVLSRLVDDRASLEQVAVNNLSEAQTKYRTSAYSAALVDILETGAGLASRR